MKKRIISIILALVFILGVTTMSTTAPGAVIIAAGIDAAQDSIEKAAEAVEAAAPIHEKLVYFITSEIDESTSEETEYIAAEAEAALRDLSNYSEQLSALLAGLNGLPDSSETSEAKTVRAAREYLKMLSNMSGDLFELINYSYELEKAVRLMDSIRVETKTNQEYSQLIWDATNNTIAALKLISPPAYLLISHDDMILRVTEFNEFAKDFYQAAELGDPLRISSCIFRKDRITRMFVICENNLSADMDLQLRQAEQRLNGPIAVLHDELNKNIAMLKNALGV